MIPLKSYPIPVNNDIQELKPRYGAADTSDNKGGAENSTHRLLTPEQKKMTANNGQSQSMRAGMTSQVSELPSFHKYVQHMWLAGSISCLEWWAVETFTFLVGTLRYESTSTLVVFFVHGCWNIFFFFFLKKNLLLLLYVGIYVCVCLVELQISFTLKQAMCSVLAYSIVLIVITIAFRDNLLKIFLSLNFANENTDHFIRQVRSTSDEILPLFTLCVFGYSIAMCFLGMFVSVAKLAQGGLFMLTGYYLVGLVTAVVTAYYWEWRLYGIWLGLAAAYASWCALSFVYWYWKKPSDHLDQVKQIHDQYEENLVGITPSMGSTSSATTLAASKSNYGSLLTDGEARAAPYSPLNTANVNEQFSIGKAATRVKQTKVQKKALKQSPVLLGQDVSNEEYEYQKTAKENSGNLSDPSDLQ
ncbi:hypothetical protein RFI_31844 [Reticulomyxa filosa]|uniref:Uncharacterized protein n=1 Tax=Reticulomyxa filosa TaxID=46433 RepID=X6LVB3_RETFI|nr:hypothetical protein RFI_31844 [Reticulomyxa filosa]|eukprot:ETO05554.1 hypothetical protein RFI_31844 [Reticulomyxa filosa]